MSTEKNFWSSNALEPKRQYRFKLEISSIQGSSIWFAKKVTIPSFTVGEIKHSFVDKTFYFPGRVEWNTVEATLVDPVTPDAASLTNAMLTKSGYFVPSGPAEDGAYGSMSKKEATEQGVSGVKIIAIDQDGVAVETWELKNPFIKSVKYGELSYDSDELREISIEFRYDWAECQIKDENKSYFQQVKSKADRYNGPSGNNSN